MLNGYNNVFEDIHMGGEGSGRKVTGERIEDMRSYWRNTAKQKYQLQKQKKEKDFQYFFDILWKEEELKVKTTMTGYQNGVPIYLQDPKDLAQRHKRTQQRAREMQATMKEIRSQMNVLAREFKKGLVDAVMAEVKKSFATGDPEVYLDLVKTFTKQHGIEAGMQFANGLLKYYDKKFSKNTETKNDDETTSSMIKQIFKQYQDQE